ncbi:MAG: ABC transporter substrate-binding protein [Rhodospirillales bacterium]|nr:ABC transporter substrate-binding protein [Rhodospirillales bacterium]
MPRRRSLVLAVLLLLLTRPAQAAGEVAEARAFVQRTGDAILAVINGPGSAAEKRSKFTRIVDGTVDVDGVAKFALGRFWRVATPAQRKTYLSLFRQYLVFNVTGRLSQYKGTTFTIGRVEPMNGDIAVTTTLHVPNSSPTDLQWIVSFASGSPKIVDLVAEGTSLRVTQRSDYASVITRNGGQNVQALLDAMRQQVARLEAGGSG